MGQKGCFSSIDNQLDITISFMTLKTTGENQNSVEKYEKKKSKPFKPLVFSENFICDPMNFLSKPMGLY